MMNDKKHIDLPDSALSLVEFSIELAREKGTWEGIIKRNCKKFKTWEVLTKEEFEDVCEKAFRE